MSTTSVLRVFIFRRQQIYNLVNEPSSLTWLRNLWPLEDMFSKSNPKYTQKAQEFAKTAHSQSDLGIITYNFP